MMFKCISCDTIAENENVIDYIEEEQSGRLNEYCSHFFVPMTKEEEIEYSIKEGLISDNR